MTTLAKRLARKQRVWRALNLAARRWGWAAVYDGAGKASVSYEGRR